MSNLFDNFIKYRYAIALICFILGVSLNLNGSSLGVWSNYGLTEMTTGERVTSENENDLSYDDWFIHTPTEDGVLFGIPRSIRSDEWRVQSSYFLSQVEGDANLINEDYGLSGMNMVVAYNSPVFHISVIGKPFNWGALFLDSSHAISWYWVSKIILYLLVSFEFLMILTKKNKYLSVIGSVVVTYTPAVQWWFMQHLGDVVLFCMLAIVTINQFFNQTSKPLKLLSAFLLSISLIGFILVIYPAFQVPFAYLIAIFFFVNFYTSIKNKSLSFFDVQVMLFTLLFVIGVVGLTIYQSWDAIIASLSTVYPGSRISYGGDVSIYQIITIFINLFLPFRVPNIANQVELSSSINLYPYILVSIPILWKKINKKENWFGLFLFIFVLLLGIYTFVGIPVLLSKLTLFSYVTGNRSWQALSVIAVWVTFWFASLVWDSKKIRKSVVVASLFTTGIIALLVVNQLEFRDYVSRTTLLIILLVYFLTYLILLKNKKVFILIILIATFISGFTVNPIVQGIDSIEEKALVKTIKNLVDESPDSLWVTESSMLYNLPQMAGANSLDGVRFYPDYKEMALLDSEDEYVENWNRYSHIKVTLTTDDTGFSNSSPDVLDLNLNIQDLDQLEVRYILTTRELQDVSKQFVRIYGPDSDGNIIYENMYSSD